MLLSKKSYEGELLVDHRASSGLNVEQAINLGYLPSLVGEGTVFEAPTMSCNHCGSIVVLNPDRKRDREYCQACDMYICDDCGLERKLPGYEHKSHRQKLELNARNLNYNG